MKVNSRTPHEQRETRAKACFSQCQERGFVCAGCDDQHLCGVLQANADWLFNQFLPAIDPAGEVFGHPEKKA